jgi:hypothetical protein
VHRPIVALPHKPGHDIHPEGAVGIEQELPIVALVCG